MPTSEPGPQAPTILLLGPVEAWVGDRALRLSGRKQRILLARLALAHGRHVSHDRLIEDIWGEEPPADPVHALQAHVSRLRGALAVRIDADAAGYRMADGPGGGAGSITVDSTQFTQLCATGRSHLDNGDPQSAAVDLRAALDLWRGPALAGIEGRLRSSVVHLEELRRSAEADLIDAELLRGNVAAVLADLQALVEDDPLHERTWRQLMLALYREGREGEALAAYHRARDAFVEQLGTEPGKRLTALHQEILERTLPQSLEPDGTPVAIPSAPVERPGLSSGRVVSALTGRDRELAVLESAWEDGREGLRVVTITGEPGIGKSRLAAELTARLTAQQAPALFGRCDRSLEIPYQPFVEMLRSDLSGLSGEALSARLGPSAGALVRLVPELADRLPVEVSAPPRSDPDTELHRTFDAVAGWLATISATAPTVLVVDDLQWADPQTTLLLHHLLKTPRRIHGLLLITYRDRWIRDESAPPDEADARTDLLRQSETLTHLPLRRLTEPEIADILDQELPHDPVDDGPAADVRANLVRWVHSASGGNPLFVVELARQIVDPTQVPVVGADPTDRLTAIDVLPDPAQSYRQDLPPGLLGIIDRRLDQLPEPMHRMMRFAATIGTEFDPTVLQRSSGADDSELDALLSAATYARLIAPVPGPSLRYTFSHDVVRAALYESIPPLRRAAMHRAVAVAIEHHRDPDLRDRYHKLAYHYSAASVGGAHPRSVHYLRLAGDLAMSQGAPSVAVEYYRRALDLLPPDTADTERRDRVARCDLTTAYGSALSRLGDPGYREVLLSAARLAIELDDRHRLTAATLANSRGWWSRTAEVDHERVAMIEAALNGCDEDDVGSRVQLIAAWALENVRDPNERDRSIERSAQAVALAEDGGDDGLLALALSHRFAVVYASFADPQDCVALSRRLLEIARRRRDPGLRLSATIGLAQSAMTVGEPDVVDRCLAEAHALAQELDHPARRWLVQGWRAMRVAMRGDLDEAEALVLATFELGTRTDQPDAATWFAGQIFTLRYLAGRLDELIDEIEAQVASQSAGIPAWRAAYALALTEAGRGDEAGAILDEFVARGFAQLPVDMLWLHGMSYLCGVAEALDRPDAARPLYEALAPYAGLFAHNGTIDAGPVDLHLGAMARLSGDLDVADRHLEAAADLCRRMDAPVWLARCASARALVG